MIPFFVAKPQISAKAETDLLVFHAGTRLGGDGLVYTDGGRVLAVVGQGEDLAEAREEVYNSISSISFEGCHYRKDIALRETKWH